MQEKRRPRILVTNDDGMFAPGIKALVEVAIEFGEVIVVAPDSPQSGKGHAVTLSQPLRLNKVNVFPGVDAYECSGTPVDCVKLAKHIIFKNQSIDLCLSGINHGSNASINIIYSGTMSAAMEASLEGIPSIGLSLMDFSFDADFLVAQNYTRHLIRNVINEGLGNCNLLNVNIPKLPADEIQGIRVCRQAKGRWIEEFSEALDPRGQKYYWLTGRFQIEDEQSDTDIWALDNGYISVVPSGHDLTMHESIDELKHLENITYAIT